jgi:DHA3 family multidrug efflux protein-like MFS transporter
MLIGLAAFNNLLAGVFMALMDPYGLLLVSVETWGLLFGLISLAFIGGGLVVARRGLGPNPLRALLAANLVNWIVCSVFTLQSSIVLVVVGLAVWLALIPVIEAARVSRSYARLAGPDGGGSADVVALTTCDPVPCPAAA